MFDSERQLDERTRLSEQDVGIDAREGTLTLFRNRGLLPVARVDFCAKTSNFDIGRSTCLSDPSDEVQRLLIH